MKKKEEAAWQKVLLAFAMLIISIPAVDISAYLYEKSFRDIFMLLIIVTACFGMTLFSFFRSNVFQALHYDNGGHLFCFVLTFLMGTAACLLPILPVFALALTLFSNTVTGLIAYAGLMCVCAYFASADILTFLLYFLTGTLFAVLFERLDDDYKTGVPMSVAVIVYVIEIAAKVIFQKHGTLTTDELVIPIMNVFVTFILMLVVLRFYCAVVIDQEKGRYLRINDQEYVLLAKYKEEDKQTYYNAIHTAYFAEKTARQLHMDVDVAKNGGYYHRIIVLECKKHNKSLEEICQENKFPPEAVRLLQEYNYKSQPMKMRETVAVYLADCVVSSIMYLIEKGGGAQFVQGL
ncbi:MAG: hypothetical protein K2H91_11595 [Lachnospiraceae bacterium]|nr:hypothetical protein [Lachnospiraceae bacterium]